MLRIIIWSIMMISLLLSCLEFPDNSFFVLNFVDEWEVYVSVDDKMSVVIAFEKVKNRAERGVLSA